MYPKYNKRLRNDDTVYKKKVTDKKKKSEIKKTLQETNGNVCFFCGETAHDLVHVIRQGYSAHLKDEIGNCVLGCRKHHTVFDDGPAESIRLLPNLEWVLEIMEAWDEQYCNRYKYRYGINSL